jgi:hypothetical protein
MEESRLIVSDSGYIHLSFAELQDICLVHLISGLDEDVPGPTPGGAIPTAITGYTEWIADGNLGVSIGWDWQMKADDRHIHLTRVGGASSNLMLQSSARTDLGPVKTALLLEALIDELDWQPATLDYVCERYSS